MASHAKSPWLVSCSPIRAAHRVWEETMPQFPGKWVYLNIYNICKRFVLTLLAVTTILAGWSYGGQSGQSDNGPASVCEGSLLYRSPLSGLYESVPLVHTDATLAVLGLPPAPTAPPKYVTSGGRPI